MKLIDLHCDTASKILMSTNGEGLRSNSFAISLPEMKKADTLVQFFACFIDMEMFQGDTRYEEAFAYCNQMIDKMQEEINVNADHIAFARCAEDIIRNREKNQISAILTLEEGALIHNDLAKLEMLYEKGIRLITLLWNFENCMGYPNSRDSDRMALGLKPFGFETVERMNELGMIIDVSHMSDGGFWDVIRHSKSPVIASHSNARALCRHPRNLTDEMLRALSDKGGVVGINFYPAFIREDAVAMAEDIVKHICYIINIAGIEAVSIGTDFDGFDGGTLEIEKIGKIELLLHTLRKKGVSDGQIEKIWSKNALRVVNEVSSRRNRE